MSVITLTSFEYSFVSNTRIITLSNTYDLITLPDVHLIYNATRNLIYYIKGGSSNKVSISGGIIVLNNHFITLRAGDILTIQLEYSINTDSSDVSNFELELSRKTIGNSYMEYTELASKVIQVNYWQDFTKVVKLFTKDIEYIGNDPATITIKDEINNKTMVTTINYVESTIVSVSKIII